jgi:hypothetical protein
MQSAVEGAQEQAMWFEDCMRGNTGESGEDDVGEAPQGGPADGA